MKLNDKENNLTKTVIVLRKNHYKRLFFIFQKGQNGQDEKSAQKLTDLAEEMKKNPLQSQQIFGNIIFRFCL